MLMLNVSIAWNCCNFLDFIRIFHCSGLDVVAILNYLGLGSTSSTISTNVASGASTFVLAYAVHKVFAPFRISLTLVLTPFIVRYLRNKGILSVKPPKPPKQPKQSQQP